MINIEMREALRKRHGLKPLRKDKLLVLHTSQWNYAFEKLMRNRLLIGYYRYGDLNSIAQGNYDNINSIRERLDRYDKTGNDEILVDCANLCLLEFTKGIHPKKHFNSVDDGIHTSKKE